MMRRIGYLVLLAAGFFQMMLYDFQGLRYLVCCAVCIPVLSGVLLLFQVFYCKVTLQTGQAFVSRGDEAEVCLRVRTRARGMLPISGISVWVKWNLPGEKGEKERLRIRGLKRNSIREIPFTLTTKHCGRVRIEVTKAVIYDWLGLFSLPLKRGEDVEFCVTPVIEPLSAEGLIDGSGNPRNWMGEKEGDLQLRDFLPGDSLHRIYWKLMAKDGEMQVRDAERSILLIFFFSFSDSFRYQPEQWDRYLDRACSLLYFFMEKGGQWAQTRLDAVWRSGEAFFRQEITDVESLQAWIQLLLMGEKTGMPFPEAEIPFLEQGFHLEEDCRLYFGEQCVYEE